MRPSAAAFTQYPFSATSRRLLGQIREPYHLSMRRRLALLDNRLEAHQVFIHRMLWIGPEHRRYEMAKRARRRVVRHTDIESRVSVCVALEAYDARVLDRSAGDAAPCDELVGHLLDDLADPPHRDPGRAGRDPAVLALADLSY